MERFNIINTLTSLFGGGVTVWLLSNIFGKKKADIELALNYQEFYKGLIEDLEEKLVLLTGKVETLINQNNAKDEIIEDQRINIEKYGNYCAELKQGIEDRDKTNGLLMDQIELLEK